MQEKLSSLLKVNINNTRMECCSASLVFEKEKNVFRNKGKVGENERRNRNMALYMYHIKIVNITHTKLLVSAPPLPASRVSPPTATIYISSILGLLLLLIFAGKHIIIITIMHGTTHCARGAEPHCISSNKNISNNGIPYHGGNSDCGHFSFNFNFAI